MHLLITGVGRGIGRAMALEAMARGWKVTGIVRNLGAAPRGVRELVVDLRDDMGGSDADEDPARVAHGILDIGATLDIARTGKFLRWTGEERAF